MEQVNTTLLRKKFGSHHSIYDKNCKHVVDTNVDGDIFCTQCKWISDPQELIQLLIDAVSDLGSARSCVKKALGWS